MTATTPRRTQALRLRQTISQLLEEVFAIEHAMEVFHRKGDRSDLDRATDSFSDMLGHIDRLGEMIADARGTQPQTADRVRDSAA
jgi:hypothetical protein